MNKKSAINRIRSLSTADALAVHNAAVAAYADDCCDDANFPCMSLYYKERAAEVTDYLLRSGKAVDTSLLDAFTDCDMFLLCKDYTLQPVWSNRVSDTIAAIIYCGSIPSDCYK